MSSPNQEEESPEAKEFVNQGKSGREKNACCNSMNELSNSKESKWKKEAKCYLVFVFFLEGDVPF